MRAPLSWIKEYAALPEEVTGRELAEKLIGIGLEVETVDEISITGPLLVGRVLEIEELTEFKKPIRYCQVDLGGQTNGIICGATNFAVGDLVPVALPGAVLPGGFEISARKTYGHISNGMICSGRELGINDDHTGILVLDPDSGAKPGEDARPYVGLNDIVIDVEITPDRGYQMSVRGLAREPAHALGLEFRHPGRAQGPNGTAGL